MALGRRGYDEVYGSRPWAYGFKPDEHLIRAMNGVPRGRALDLGGGQGRHALALAELGFDVLLVDRSAEALHQASNEAERRGVALRIVDSDAVSYEPSPPLSVAVASLFFQHPAKRTALKVARRLGAALQRRGLFYLSLPGFSKDTEAFAEQILRAGGCEVEWVTKHLVTPEERPGLGVPRRNETRALGSR